MQYKIAMVVHGRFHAFDLARALLARGHQVTLYTNYPQWIVKRFGISTEHVESFWFHGLLARSVAILQRFGTIVCIEAVLHRLFGHWATRQLKKQQWDVVIAWSGISEEILDALPMRGIPCLLTRGSAHIKTQARILGEEEARTNMPQDRPSDWMIQREEREYAKANCILVLSQFARRTFQEFGFTDQKVQITPLGVEVSDFRPDPTIIQKRCDRIRSGAPLHILYVGTKSFQKGMWDLRQVAEQLQHENFQFRLVGPSPRETEVYLNPLYSFVEFISKEPQSALPDHYAWGDIFLFPTIQDGFAVVLTQAAASGLPILATTNCAAPDFVREGKTGWVVPIRSADQIVERLRWCNEHRIELAQMVHNVYERFEPYTWEHAAADLEKVLLTL